MMKFIKTRVPQITGVKMTLKEFFVAIDDIELYITVDGKEVGIMCDGGELSYSKDIEKEVLTFSFDEDYIRDINDPAEAEPVEAA